MSFSYSLTLNIYASPTLFIGSGEVSLGIGEHSYPFSFILPNIALPTSYEGSNGKVCYFIKGTIEQPSWENTGGNRHNCTEEFTVKSIVDLNFNPLARVNLV